MKKCSREDCDCFPYYGLAPHEHVIGLVGSTKFTKEVPSNFKADEEGNGTHGIYLCPECMEDGDGER